MTDFYPPRLNPFLVRCFQSIIALIGHGYYRMRLEVRPDSLERLRSLRGKRVLLLPNHPTFHDWIATFLLSAKTGDLFYYLAAHERFRGWIGQLLQRLGAYSIRRGLGDRPSVGKTIELLMQPQCRLVIFPEGGCSFQNDTVMPFRPGAVQIALQAMSKLARKGEPIPDLYAVPLSLKYRYTGDMTPVINDLLSRLERALDLSAATDPYERLRIIAERVLSGLEQDYGLDTNTVLRLNWNDRIPRLRTGVLKACERHLGLKATPNMPVRERVYQIQYTLEARAETLPDDPVWTYESMHKAAARMLNFDAIYDGYVADQPTPERFLDTLTRLERTVFSIDQPPSRGYRKVMLHVGNPVNLKDYYEQYQRDRSETVRVVTQELHSRVQQNLDLLAKGVIVGWK